jgi:hypothetical protein
LKATFKDEKMIIFIGSCRPAPRNGILCFVVFGSDPQDHQEGRGNGGLHRYALVQSHSDRGRRIGRLHGRPVDHTLVAREFSRSAGNERRRLDWREIPWTAPKGVAGGAPSRLTAADARP